MTGIVNGPILPSDEIRPTTLPTVLESRSCLAGIVKLMVSAPIHVNPETKMHTSRRGIEA